MLITTNTKNNIEKKDTGTILVLEKHNQTLPETLWQYQAFS
jgi:hypothetical protein